MAETIRQNLGPVSAYALAKKHGYTGTEEEFSKGLYKTGEYAQEAKAAAAGASGSASAAAESVTLAGAAAERAETAKSGAEAAAGNASRSAEAAAGSVTQASGEATKAEAAAGKAETAQKAAEEAATKTKTAVLYEKQELTGEQKTQARTNIGACTANQSEINLFYGDYSTKAVNNGVLTFFGNEDRTAIIEMNPGKEYFISVRGKFNRFVVLVSDFPDSGLEKIYTGKTVYTGYNETNYTFKNTKNKKYLFVFLNVTFEDSTFDAELFCKDISNQTNENFEINGIRVPKYSQVAIANYSKITFLIEHILVNHDIINMNEQNARSAVIPIKRGRKYVVKTQGYYNRLYAHVCKNKDFVHAGKVEKIYSSDVTNTTEQVRTFEYINTENDKLIVCISFGEELDGTLIVEEIAGDGSDYDHKINGVAFLQKSEYEASVTKDKYSFYQTAPDLNNIRNTKDLYKKYDTLLAKYPDYISKSVLGTNSQGTEIREYVFDLGEKYNDASRKTMRGLDPEIKKPVALIVTGIHGYEQASVSGTYKFFEDLCNRNPALCNLFGNVVFKLIPVVCPWGYDNNSRINENGVNINRNFEKYWAPVPKGNDYSGESAADQKETQIIQNWVKKNSDAYCYVDYHNSGFDTEIACLAGNHGIAKIEKLKKQFLTSLYEVASAWEDKKIVDPKNEIIAYTTHLGNSAFSYNFAQTTGVPSFCLEGSWNPGGRDGLHSNNAIKINAETLGNMLVGWFKDMSFLGESNA